MDCWVLQPPKTNPNANPKLYEVYFLSQFDGRWLIQETSTWGETKGSSEFLMSVCLPETTIYLNTTRFELDEFESLEPSAIWGHLGSQLTFGYWAFAHEQLAESAALHSKTLRVVQTNQIEKAPDADALVKLGPEQAQTLALLNRKNASLPQMQTALCLKTTRRRNTTRLAAICLSGLLCLGTWHLLPNLLDQHMSEQIQLQLMKSKVEHNRLSPDWESAFLQLKKFGSRNRANLSEVSLSWNPVGEIHTEVKLHKPRKRLPKACEVKDYPRVSCPVVEPKIMK